jgi:predicted O-linked N-acetylglucosamine transferase (SPINDLY family)
VVVASTPFETSAESQAYSKVFQLFDRQKLQVFFNVPQGERTVSASCTGGYRSMAFGRMDDVLSPLRINRIS